jgi:phosphate acetyltransferase
MKNDFLTRLVPAARSLGRAVAFPDALDPRTIRAAGRLAAERIVRPVLVGPADRIAALAASEAIDLTGVVIEDPAASSHRAAVADGLAALDAARRGGPKPGQAGPGNPLIFAGMLARLGIVHGSVAGSLSTTADVFRAALRTVALRPGVTKVSSYFLMVFPGRVMAFADCGVLPDPTDAELSEIAGLACDNFGAITGEVPVVAFLSFSSKGSADHPMVDKVRSAAAMFRTARPAVVSDGELQLDAAIVPDVALRKAGGSPAAGKANVLIFPDLGAGNIGYKIAERLGGAVALGPILQGLAKPAFDLSRGCSVEDIVRVAAINALTAP